MRRPAARRPPGPVRRPMPKPRPHVDPAAMVEQIRREKAADDAKVLAFLSACEQEVYVVEVAKGLEWDVPRAKRALTRLHVAGEVVSRVLTHEEHGGRTGQSRRYYWVRG